MTWIWHDRLLIKMMTEHEYYVIETCCQGPVYALWDSYGVLTGCLTLTCLWRLLVPPPTHPSSRLSRTSLVNIDSENIPRDHPRFFPCQSPKHQWRLASMYRHVNSATTRERRECRLAAWRRFDLLFGLYFVKSGLWLINPGPCAGPIINIWCLQKPVPNHRHWTYTRNGFADFYQSEAFIALWTPHSQSDYKYYSKARVARLCITVDNEHHQW